MNASAALERLRDWERLPLATLPTPLYRAQRLAAALGDPPIDLYVKMDAETGLSSNSSLPPRGSRGSLGS